MVKTDSDDEWTGKVFQEIVYVDKTMKANHFAFKS